MVDYYISNYVALEGKVFKNFSESSEDTVQACIFKEGKCGDYFYLPKSIFDELFHPVETQAERAYIEMCRFKQALNKRIEDLDFSRYIEFTKYDDHYPELVALIKHHKFILEECKRIRTSLYKGEKSKSSINITDLRIGDIVCNKHNKIPMRVVGIFDNGLVQLDFDGNKDNVLEGYCKDLVLEFVEEAQSQKSGL